MNNPWFLDLPTGTARHAALSSHTQHQEVISYPRAATLFASVCAILFIVLGILGNAITALALTRCPKLRGHATTAFVLSLCASDLLFCALSLPLTAVRYISEAWTLGPELCSLFPVLFYGNVAVSLLSMVAITTNRYVLISHHGWYGRLYSRGCIATQLILIWVLSFAMMLPPMLGIWGQLGLDPPTFSCTILKKDGHSPKKFLFLVGFALPCAVIIIAYSCIYWKVRASRRNLQAHNDANAKGVVPSGRSYTVREREDSRLTALMLTIFLCFVACFLPLMLVNVVDGDRLPRAPALHVLASVLAWASSVINPFIYAATNRQYRSAYCKLFSCLRPDTVVQREIPNSNNNPPNSSSPAHSTPVSGCNKSQSPGPTPVSALTSGPPQIKDMQRNKF